MKSLVYGTLAYAVIMFLIFHFVTDQELPLYRVLFKVGFSSVIMFFVFRRIAGLDKGQRKKAS